MSDPVIHRLREKDMSTMTARCTVCGLVAIRKAGNGFTCATKKAMAQKSWQQRNPEKAAANRRLKSEHELFARDYVKLTAVCSICGPVSMAPYGRGYTCANRNAELREVSEEAPQKACPDCKALERITVWLTAEGVCRRCVEITDLAPIAEQVLPGFTIRYSDDYPDDRESAVPGWKVIGSERPWNEV